MIIVVVAPRSNYSKKQLKVYGAAIQAENEFEEKYDMPIDISYMANSKHLNEKVLAGDGFFFKKVNTK
jgi:hypothetical protein